MPSPTVCTVTVTVTVTYPKFDLHTAHHPQQITLSPSFFSLDDFHTGRTGGVQASSVSPSPSPLPSLLLSLSPCYLPSSWNWEALAVPCTYIQPPRSSLLQASPLVERPRPCIHENPISTTLLPYRPLAHRLHMAKSATPPEPPEPPEPAPAHWLEATSEEIILIVVVALGLR